LSDIILRLLDENTEILNKYEKIAVANFDDTDIKSEVYFTNNRGLRYSYVAPAMKSAAQHLSTECEELVDSDPVFENTINKEYGLVGEDLEK
jgi:hypothetical protein